QADPDDRAQLDAPGGEQIRQQLHPYRDGEVGRSRADGQDSGWCDLAAVGTGHDWISVRPAAWNAGCSEVPGRPGGRGVNVSAVAIEVGSQVDAGAVGADREGVLQLPAGTGGNKDHQEEGERDSCQAQHYAVADAVVREQQQPYPGSRQWTSDQSGRTT